MLISRGPLLLTRLLISQGSQPLSSCCRLWSNDDSKPTQLQLQRPSGPAQTKREGDMQVNKLSKILRKFKGETEEETEADSRSGNIASHVTKYSRLAFLHEFVNQDCQ